MKKMFVFDYDGTYYRNTNELLSNIKLLETVRQQGHLLVIATGRSYLSFIKEIKKFNIQYDYLVLSGGALILDQNETVIKSYPMDMALVKNVDLLLEPFHARLESQMFIDEFMNSELLSQLNQVIKMTYTYYKGDICYDVKELVDESTNGMFKSYVIRGQSVDYVEIISSNTNKGIAILDLLAYLNTPYDVIAAGDSENDIEMLIEFDGYLMTNHDPSLNTYKLRLIDSIEELIYQTITL